MGCWPSPDDPYCARLRSCFILSYNTYMLLLLLLLGGPGLLLLLGGPGSGRWEGGGITLWARAWRVSRSKTRLGCAEMARACKDIGPCTISASPNPHFRSRYLADLASWTDIPWEWSITSQRTDRRMGWGWEGKEECIDQEGGADVGS